MEGVKAEHDLNAHMREQENEVGLIGIDGFRGEVGGCKGRASCELRGNPVRSVHGAWRFRPWKKDGDGGKLRLDRLGAVARRAWVGGSNGDGSGEEGKMREGGDGGGFRPVWTPPHAPDQVGFGLGGGRHEAPMYGRTGVRCAPVGRSGWLTGGTCPEYTRAYFLFQEFPACGFLSQRKF